MRQLHHGAKTVQIPTEEDGSLLLEAVLACFPGTRTLTYWEPNLRLHRALPVRMNGDLSEILSPPDGWDENRPFYCVGPEGFIVPYSSSTSTKNTGGDSSSSGNGVVEFTDSDNHAIMIGCLLFLGLVVAYIYLNFKTG